MDNKIRQIDVLQRCKWDYEKPIGERWVEINLRGRHGA